MNKKQQGYVLITVLLFLSLLSMLVLQLLENSVWQQKMQRLAQQQQHLIMIANQGLRVGEQSLQNRCTKTLCINVTLLQTLHCALNKQVSVPIQFVKVTVTAIQSNVQATVESTYAKFPTEFSYCDDIVAGRQSWRLVGEP